MDFLIPFIEVVISGAAWDAIKSGSQLSCNWLKERLVEQKFPIELNQSQLDALVTVLQNAPPETKSAPSAFAEYLKSQHIRPIIEKHLHQHNQINIGGDNTGVVVGGNVNGGITNR